jgi:NADPH-dependent ferric siderophore reductase
VGLDPPQPAASVRLLVPGRGELVLPEWNGNEYLHADGSRPPLRTLTPLRIDPVAGEVDVEVVLHGDGPLARWATGARPGDEVAISGTGRGYEIDAEASRFVLIGDESAVPAITTILGALPHHAEARVLVEAADPTAELPLGGPRTTHVTWHLAPRHDPPGEALVAAVVATPLSADDRVWAAGEAAAVQRIRRHLFEELGLPRTRAVVRGYWKHGRAAGGDDA